MNFFDFEIITFINHFSQGSFLLDKIIVFLSCNNLLKGGIFVTIIWWAWFKSDDLHPYNRQHIISTLFCSLAVIIIVRVLLLTLPFRPRPIHEESLNFLLPHGMIQKNLEGWSSMPSDHAGLFFTLSTGLLFISRRVGIFAFFYSILFISFPRIYLGLHYPTDIIAGAMIGIAVALMGNIYLVNNKNIQLIENLSNSKPSYFYPIFFLLTYQIADTFDSSRFVVNGMLKFFKGIM